MKHSFFCQDSVLIDIRHFRFANCDIEVSFFTMDEVYFVEIRRFSHYDFKNCTSRYCEVVGLQFYSSFKQYHYLLKRYRYYEELYRNNKLR